MPMTQKNLRDFSGRTKRMWEDLATFRKHLDVQVNYLASIYEKSPAPRAAAGGRPAITATEGRRLAEIEMSNEGPSVTLPALFLFALLMSYLWRRFTAPK